MLPDYLDVDSPAQRGKKEKKRRKVERNTKLSRSLDSLKELHGKETDLYTVTDKSCLYVPAQTLIRICSQFISSC